MKMEPFSDQVARINISIDSCLDQVFMVGAAIRGICAELQLAAGVASPLELAVIEGVNNAVKHAYESQAGHCVEVIVAVSREWIRFEICDEGKPLNFQRGTALDYDPHDRKNLPEGGMGLHIMGRVMDEISYSSREGRNRLILCKRLG